MGSEERAGRTAVAAERQAQARLLGALHGLPIAFAELREMDDAAQIADATARATVALMGFDRCIVFSVAGQELIARSVCFGADTAWAARTLAVGQSEGGRPQLGDSLVETESLRRRSAALVPDAQNDPRTPRALVEETRTRSYVAAPLLCEDRVVGFVHADHFDKGTEVDEADRQALTAFAAGVGLVLERLTVRRHLASQRATLRHLARDMDEAADRAPLLGVALDPIEPGGGHAGRVVDLSAPRAGLAVLSTREREVLELLASGATNAVIARRLFVTESTVKAHVHNLLKKLGAVNRADAVSRFLRGGEHRPPGWGPTPPQE